MTPRPNVVWISTHDINPHLGTYSGVWPGAEYADTPNLDRLAAEGARWDNALANAPVCAPSRSAIMTGCYPTAIGTMHMRTKAVPPPEVRLLPEYFREAGYWVSSTPFTDFQVHTPAVTFDECSPGAHWRNRPDPAQPFFAMFHGMITHESQIYLDDEDFEQATSRLTPSQRHDPEKAPLPPYYPDTPVFRRAWARYNDLISAMDHWVGDLLRQLDEDGLTENTIVVFWSDHGLGMPRAKRWASEAGLREPLIVRWPRRMTPGQERTELVQLLDLAPTMLETCGLPVPEHMHGRPFLDARGAALDPNAYVFAGRDRMDEQEDTVRTVRDGRFRYVRNLHPDRPGMGHHEYADRLATWAELRRLSFAEANQRAAGDAPSLLTPLQRSILAASRPAEELYDVLHDPHETVDLAPDPAHAATLERLRDALDEWTARHGDLGLVPEDELLARWQPGGVRPTTPAPQITRGRADLSVTCSEPGARIGWTTDPPVTDRAPDPSADAIGSPPADNRRWHLTTGLVPAPTSAPIWVRAWRLGHEPSPEIRVEPA